MYKSEIGSSNTHCTCGAIDIHCHVVPSRFPAAAGRSVRGWPTMIPAGACHATIVIDEKPYRNLSDACWVAERRLDEMDRTGIHMQALSPMPELYSYWLETRVAYDLIRYINDTLAKLVTEGQGRFVGLAGVPLQDLDLAITELRRAVNDLGLRGVAIGSNVNGVAIGDPRFQPFFAEVERLGSKVFVHALRPVGMERLVGPAPLQQVLAYPNDVGLAMASVITGGLLQQFPGLRIAFSHGGGTFAALLPRLEQGYKTFPALQEQMPEPPSTQARRLYVDSLVFDAPLLRHLVEVFGQTKVMLGTDYPFNFREVAPVARIEQAFPQTDLRERLIRTNARTFLGMDEV